eukprot:CAMPEP_0174743596 /NCGR_PEP_ID=MMETSP1094-20130205/82036_1 /TAXON_ID=156173 /ORGANISM="Chrysochromulina brevifilum, Strain UTEX LB 985" /LENGTH=156 /DNA_ID=CAMNT_0015947841 /DNA_START=134 /DNA_END=604 /DNA_ORIENTATION=-
MEGLSMDGEEGRELLNQAQREFVALSGLMSAVTKRYLVVLSSANFPGGSASVMPHGSEVRSEASVPLPTTLLEHVGVIDQAELEAEAEIEVEEERMESEGVDYMGRSVWENASPQVRDSRWFKVKLAAASVKRLVAVGLWRRSAARTAPAEPPLTE